MAVMNTGKVAHDHALQVLKLLTHEYWNSELMEKIKNELKSSYSNLNEHLCGGKCHCGDKQSDIDFYQTMYEDMREAVSSQSMSVVPVLQEQLWEFFQDKEKSHRCIQSLMNTKHKWVQEMD
ncbi:hypothetical protein BTR23_24755 [Alkalihalophilus pseudofirmus]|uniref:hypothetical protein n=1 Tax=Alkalihalobacterium alkalinitrilicum TaxID=427920 RepID=UPI00094C0C7E|nr:hypothetical protein [Alkalihalobacterium alkalinitrilicum]OLO25355.1 hypothetical protein BTR23_24755 [Alkalihalophilus pseudofirmus]